MDSVVVEVEVLLGCPLESDDCLAFIEFKAFEYKTHKIIHRSLTVKQNE